MRVLLTARKCRRLTTIALALAVSQSASAHNALNFGNTPIGKAYGDLETKAAAAAKFAHDNDVPANYFLGRAVPTACVSYDSNTIRAVKTSADRHLAYANALRAELIYLESIEPQLDPTTLKAVRVVEQQIDDERVATQTDAVRQLMLLIRNCH
jgi:hypothetical protein